MKKEFNPKKCITCHKCSSYPVYKDHAVFCPNCGFRVELKLHQADPTQHWNNAVTNAERILLAKKTVRSGKSYKATLKANAHWMQPLDTCMDDDGIFDPDGFYYEQCSERSCAERLGFIDATRGRYERDSGMYEKDIFDEDYECY